MAISDEFKKELKAGNISKAFAMALSEAIGLEITTWVATTDATGQEIEHPQAGLRMRTRMNLIDGQVEHEVGSEFLNAGPYAELREFHINQVKEGREIIQSNLKSLQTLFETWLEMRHIESQITTTNPELPNPAIPLNPVIEAAALPNREDVSEVINWEAKLREGEVTTLEPEISEPLLPDPVTPKSEEIPPEISPFSPAAPSELFTSLTDWEVLEPEMALTSDSLDAAFIESLLEDSPPSEPLGEMEPMATLPSLTENLEQFGQSMIEIQDSATLEEMNPQRAMAPETVDEEIQLPTVDTSFADDSEVLLPTIMVDITSVTEITSEMITESTEVSLPTMTEEFSDLSAAIAVETHPPDGLEDDLDLNLEPVLPVLEETTALSMDTELLISADHLPDLDADQELSEMGVETAILTPLTTYPPLYGDTTSPLMSQAVEALGDLAFGVAGSGQVEGLLEDLQISSLRSQSFSHPSRTLVSAGEPAAAASEPLIPEIPEDPWEADAVTPPEQDFTPSPAVDDRPSSDAIAPVSDLEYAEPGYIEELADLDDPFAVDLLIDYPEAMELSTPSPEPTPVTEEALPGLAAGVAEVAATPESIPALSDPPVLAPQDSTTDFPLVDAPEDGLAATESAEQIPAAASPFHDSRHSAVMGDSLTDSEVAEEVAELAPRVLEATAVSIEESLADLFGNLYATAEEPQGPPMVELSTPPPTAEDDTFALEPTAPSTEESNPDANLSIEELLADLFSEPYPPVSTPTTPPIDHPIRPSEGHPPTEPAVDLFYEELNAFADAAPLPEFDFDSPASAAPSPDPTTQ
ncbi:hypothetical protein [Neosynechococcus sphagnicola]|uniref:hypothetical protein n=1 Tax=Neosynechococcus sphagnicola TaxID=1501145 RepID=UPI00068FD61A|nr:hypothetical protein [Neosynechococcus sphagnicola]